MFFFLFTIDRYRTFKSGKYFFAHDIVNDTHVTFFNEDPSVEMF